MKKSFQIFAFTAMVFIVGAWFGAAANESLSPPKVVVEEHHHFEVPATPETKMNVLIRNNGPEHTFAKFFHDVTEFEIVVKKGFIYRISYKTGDKIMQIPLTRPDYHLFMYLEDIPQEEAFDK